MGVSRIRKKHIFFNPNIARKKSNKRYDKAVQRFILLTKKEKKEGLTKWISLTKERCMLRIKKYGISKSVLDRELKKRGM